MPNAKPEHSIRWKLALAFIGVACLFAVFVGVAIAIYFESVERAAQLEAKHVAEAIADSVVENGHLKPQLQELVAHLYSLLNRDILIVDASKKGIASAEPIEVGRTYTDDLANEIGQTINDGQTRTYIEQNDRHPTGVRQVVVPLRGNAPDLGGRAIGAISLEYTSIRDQLFAVERRQIELIVAMGFAIVLLVVFFGVGFAKRISRPLVDLKSSVDRIAAEDYEARVVIESRDEIGHLGLAFNKMAEELSVSHAKLLAHRSELERRVAERTSDLDRSNTSLQREVHQHKLAAERADYLAYYDPLTGLANRALFHERLQQSVAETKEDERRLALLILDIEGFKTINDTLGAAAGDALLKELATRLSRYAKSTARLARIAADHFAILLVDVRTEGELAHLIERRFGEVFGPPFLIANSELRVSAKCGVALFPSDGVDADTLFRNAEVALKSAKVSGTRYVFFTSAMNARVAGRLSLENQLHQAVEKGEFVLYYQPKFNTSSGRLSGAEALIRWNNPRTGIVAPNEFISILEETGLIHEVGRWAKRRAVHDYLRWRAAGLNPVRIAVNVSPLQLRRRDFIADVETTVGIDPHAAAGLELEITEGVIMEDFANVVASLLAIRALGVTVAIDDFGTGFSSLSYLAKLPVDALKIDRSFVTDMNAGSHGLALVSTIINLAHSLKLKVVAEGVETEEQSRLLRLLGCDEMQGFLFSKAVPSEIFEAKYLVPSPARPELATAA